LIGVFCALQHGLGRTEQHAFRNDDGCTTAVIKKPETPEGMETTASRRFSAVLTPPEITPQRPHCLAGVGGLELRNPCESYVFETSW
jgi:hypothetical protein